MATYPIIPILPEGATGMFQMEHIPRKCKVCNDNYILAVLASDLERWYTTREPVQDVFHYATAEQREMLISGIHSACFDSIFAE